MSNIEHSNMAWSDESLILFYYRELEPLEAKKLAQELAHSDKLQTRYQALTKMLDSGLNKEVPSPNNNLNQNIMAAVYQSIEQQESHNNESKTHLVQQKKNLLLNWCSAFKPSYAFSFCLVAVLGFSLFYMGRMSVDTPQTQEWAIANGGEKNNNQQQAFSERDSQRVLYASLEKHLDSSSRLLTNVINTDSLDSDQMSQRKQHLDDLISFNRLYRQLIVKSGDKQLAHLLMQMESILLELRNANVTTSDKTLMTQDELEHVKKRLNKSDLLFKMKVSNKKLQQRMI